MEAMMNTETRVWAAADELFAACERERFPRVYDVRKLCGVGMPETNRAMQTWRARQLLSIAKPLQVAIPASVQEAGKSSLSQLWAAAIEISGESLVAAQRAFDEKAEIARASDEDLVAAFETQAADLAGLRCEYEAHRTSSSAAITANQLELHDIRTQLMLSRDQANAAIARFEESQKHVIDLKAALEREQANAKNVWDQRVECNTRIEVRLSAALKRENIAVKASERYRRKWESLKDRNAK